MQTEYGEELWKALQICDSSFPGGSFAHSFGLESALNHRFVTEEVGTLDSFVLLTLEQANSQLIPFVVSAHDLYFCSSSADLSHPVNLGRDDILNEFTIIDGTCHISLTNEVARRSSINQGKCFLRAATEAFSSTAGELKQLSDKLTSMKDHEIKNLRTKNVSSSVSVDCNDPLVNSHAQKPLSDDAANPISKRFRCHYAPIFGAVCATLNISKGMTMRMFLRCIVRDIFSSAARLNIMGPLEGAKKQNEFSSIIEKVLTSFRPSEGLNMTMGVTTFPLDVKEKTSCSASHASTESTSALESGIAKRQRVESVITSPILELLQARHDVLYARLFNS